jgi:N-acetylneuraminic acid mutarotase
VVESHGGYFFDTAVVRAGDLVLVVHGSSGRADRVAVDVVDLGDERVREAPRSPLHWRCCHAAVWSGSELLLWGGSQGSVGDPQGAAYDPDAGSWRTLPEAPVEPTVEAFAWTGDALLVWGADGEGSATIAYRPATNDWTRLEDGPLESRHRAASVWTGRELAIWGGCRAVGGECQDPIPGDELADGARFDPRSNRWRKLPPAPVAPRDYAAAAWTGREMIVWGGSGGSSELPFVGAAFDPGRDRWRVLAASPLSERRIYHSLVWTGAEVVVWAGEEGEGGALANLRANGARYDPRNDTWAELPAAPSGPRRTHGAAWTGSGMIVAGGFPNAETWLLRLGPTPSG